VVVVCLDWNTVTGIRSNSLSSVYTNYNYNYGDLIRIEKQ
jgi:hypothetical protein